MLVLCKCALFSFPPSFRALCGLSPHPIQVMVLVQVLVRGVGFLGSQRAFMTVAGGLGPVCRDASGRPGKLLRVQAAGGLET